MTNSVFTEINPWTQVSPDQLPVFNEASALVVAKLAVYRHCMIVAPRDTGKSVLLDETASKVAFAFKGAAVRLLDAGKLVASAETVQETIEQLAIFSEHVGPDGYIFVDNIGRYSTVTEDPENNKARLDATTFFAKLLDDPEAANICVATRGLEPQVEPGTAGFIDLRTKFSDQERFEFDGAIDASTARQLLSDEFDRLEIDRILGEIAPDELTYRRIKSEFEKKTSKEISDELEAEVVPLSQDEHRARAAIHRQIGRLLNPKQ